MKGTRQVVALIANSPEFIMAGEISTGLADLARMKTAERGAGKQEFNTQMNSGVKENMATAKYYKG